MNLFEQVSPWIPEAYRSRFWNAYFSATPLSGVAFEFCRMKGLLRQGGKEATLVFCYRSVAFADYLAQRFFAGEPEVTRLASCRIWNLLRRLKTEAEQSDLVFVQTGRHLASRLFGRDWIRMPAWVGMKTWLPKDPAAQRKMWNRVDGDLQQIRRNGLVCRKGQPTDASIEEFYTDYYRPTTSSRHGSHAVLPTVKFLKELSGEKHLIWVEKDDQRLAGALIEQQGDSMHFRAIGVRNGNAALSRMGALAACYYYSLLASLELECDSLDFRGCRPSVSDGVLQYKRKWGAELNDGYALASEDISVSWCRVSPALEFLLASFCPIFRHGKGLAATTAGNQKVPPGIVHCLSMDRIDFPASPVVLRQQLDQLPRSATASKK